MTKEQALAQLTNMRDMWREIRDEEVAAGRTDSGIRNRTGARATELDFAIEIVEQITEL